MGRGLAVVLALALCGCAGAPPTQTGTSGTSVLTLGSVPGAAPRCRRGAAPSDEHLGLTPEQLLGCIRALLLAQDPPELARVPFAEVAGEQTYLTYHIPGLVGVVMLPHENGYVRAVDVMIFNRLRKHHGRGPELKAHYAALATLLPGAGADPERGEHYYRQIVAYLPEHGRPTVLTRHDGIKIESTFFPSSSRHRFVPERG